MLTYNEKLSVVDAETLMDEYIPKLNYCVETLLPQGLNILGGAPKIGKSMLVLYLCDCISKGNDFLGLKTNKSPVLYISLEDTARRLQTRLINISDEGSEEMFLVTESRTLGTGLIEQLEDFLIDYPETKLIVIDTFQLVRDENSDMSYGNDYRDVSLLKQFADNHCVSILLVMHLRKQGDSDPFNRISGTTGIIGAADNMYILDRSDRGEDSAKLKCTGRDIETRDLELKFNKEECKWELVGDSLQQPEYSLPKIMFDLVDFMKAIGSFNGTNTTFCEEFCKHSGREITAKTLKQMMNKYRHELEKANVYFQNRRTSGCRLLGISYIEIKPETEVSEEVVLV